MRRAARKSRCLYRSQSVAKADDCAAPWLIMAFLDVEVLNALNCDISDGLDTVSSFLIA
jgi:hypothetical protein